MTGRAILFEKLILEGFGPYRDPIAFNFSPGINCYIADNETGKTSMVDGLLAVLFGLTHRQHSHSGYSLERFRNWNQPAACRGQLDFLAGGKKFRIQRDFDNHRVSLWQLSEKAESGRLLVEGQHNPEARKPLKRYEEILHRILGIHSRELFEDILFLSQPIPETAKISLELESLLTGSKGASFNYGLDWLLVDLRSLTRYTGPNHRGITPRNQTKDGTLEVLNEQIQALDAQIASSRQTGDGLPEVQAKLMDIEAEWQKARMEKRQIEEARLAWNNWQLLANRYQTAANQRRKYQSILEKVDQLEKELEDSQSILMIEYPEFTGEIPGFATDLEKLIQLNQALAELEKFHLRQEEEQKQWQEKQHELTIYLEKFIGWEVLGQDPAEKIKALHGQAVICLENWECYQEESGQLSKINQLLDESYFSFETATQQELEMAKNWDRIQTAMAAETEQARQAYQLADKKILDWQMKTDQTKLAFSDLTVWSELAIKAAHQKWELRQRKRELEKQSLSVSGSKNISFPIRLLVGLGCSLLVGFLVGTDQPLALAIGLLLAFLAGFIGLKFTPPYNQSQKDGEKLLQTMEYVDEQIRICDQQLGPFSRLNDLELARLLERFRLYHQERWRLEILMEEIQAINLAELEQTWLDKQQAEADLRQEMLKFQVDTESITEAYDDWKYLKKEKQHLERSIHQFTQDTFGYSPALAAQVKPDDYPVEKHWRELTAVLPILLGETMAGKSVTIQSFIDSLKGLDNGWWDKREEEAKELTKIRQEQSQWGYRLEAGANRLLEERDKIHALRLEKEGLEKTWQAILLVNNNHPDQALRRYRQFQELKTRMEQIKARQTAFYQSCQVSGRIPLLSLHDRYQDEATGWMRQWQELGSQFPSLPEPEQVDQPELIQRKLEELETSWIQVNRIVQEREDQKTDYLRQLARLESIRPLDIAVSELELQDLREERTRQERQADALTLAYKEMESAIQEYRQTHQQRLQEKMNAYFQKISGVAKRRITLDEQFNLGLEVSGRPIPLASLSKGARDQLYLSLRFAVADLLAEDMILPLILDDPFTNTDAQRLERIHQILEKQARERQFLLLAHAHHYQNWGRQIQLVKNPTMNG